GAGGGPRAVIVLARLLRARGEEPGSSDLSLGEAEGGQIVPEVGRQGRRGGPEVLLQLGAVLGPAQGTVDEGLAQAELEDDADHGHAARAGVRRRTRRTNLAAPVVEAPGRRQLPRGDARADALAHAVGVLADQEPVRQG